MIWRTQILIRRFTFQQYGTILDVEIIFNERGSKVSNFLITQIKWLPEIQSIRGFHCGYFLLSLFNVKRNQRSNKLNKLLQLRSQCLLYKHLRLFLR